MNYQFSKYQAAEIGRQVQQACSMKIDASSLKDIVCMYRETSKSEKIEVFVWTIGRL